MVRPMRLVQGTVVLVKVAVIGAVTTMCVTTGASGTATSGSGLLADDAPTPTAARIAHLMSAYDCSTTGFGADVIPGSAIVERSSRVHLVTFDAGWATFTGERPGTLVAVCRTAL